MVANPPRADFLAGNSTRAGRVITSLMEVEALKGKDWRPVPPALNPRDILRKDLSIPVKMREAKPPG